MLECTVLRHSIFPESPAFFAAMKYVRLHCKHIRTVRTGPRPEIIRVLPILLTTFHWANYLRYADDVQVVIKYDIHFSFDLFGEKISLQGVNLIALIIYFFSAFSCDGIIKVIPNYIWNKPLVVVQINNKLITWILKLQKP